MIANKIFFRSGVSNGLCHSQLLAGEAVPDIEDPDLDIEDPGLDIEDPGLDIEDPGRCGIPGKRLFALDLADPEELCLRGFKFASMEVLCKCSILVPFAFLNLSKDGVVF